MRGVWQRADVGREAEKGADAGGAFAAVVEDDDAVGVLRGDHKAVATVGVVTKDGEAGQCKRDAARAALDVDSDDLA